MSHGLELIGASALFVFGLRLSAFFSGTETGFYRASFVRLSIEAHAGDRAAGRVLRFVRNPSAFLATTLVGNNVANYITTLAIGLGTAALLRQKLPIVEIASTLMISPVIFVFGELMPKNLYYRAPMTLLRRDSSLFEFFSRLFLPVSFPLMGIARLLQRRGASSGQVLDLVLGRKRLVQVLREGHEHGLLTDVQRRLTHGVLHTAAETVIQTMTPLDRILGVSDDVSKDAVVDFAHRFGLPNVAVKRAGTEDDWYGYVRVVDAVLSHQPLSALVHTMPRLERESSKLQALTRLHESGATYGLVCEAGGRAFGIASERGLTEQLIRPVEAFGPRTANENTIP